MGPRDHLLAIYGAAVDAVSGRIAVAEFLRHKPPTPSAIIAVGKAAPHMLAGAYDALAGCDFDALVITKYGYDEDLYPPDAAVTRIESAHPVPDESSLAAGAQLLTFVRQQAPGTHLLMLYSGGASSLVEVLPEGMDAEALARLNRWLLASGLSIGPMNRIRKRVSCIKAGRLAAHVQGSMTNLLISDVPGDDPKVVGSGPLARHQQEDIQVDDLDLPGWLQEMTDKAPPLAPSAAFEQISTHVIAHPPLAAETAVATARKRGYAVHLHEE
ncbi:MAG: hydroxypyruvate reductase, partial [Gammaproteobacteria bacterium]